MTAEPGTALSVDRPFPGLRPYVFEDSPFYFGREDQIYSLYRLLDRSHFIAVVGSSGSGKSSLVRAGLLPLLDDETKNAGGRSWRWVEMRPGDAPLKRLADALASLMPEGEDDVDRAINAARRERIGFALRQSSFGLAEALDKIEGLGDSSFILVVDQFEELFRYAASTTGQKGGPGTEALWREDAAHFVQLLLEISRSRTRAVHVVITMRSDFIGDCARFHGLPEAVSATQFLVPSLTRDQREEVIRKPIEKAGATIEPTLVERLLNDSGDELDQLPVVQHCLMRLWDRAGIDARLSTSAESGWNNVEAHPTARHLTIEHYQAIGTIASALSQHAEEILASLPGLELAVEQACRGLAEVDRAGRAIRRAVPFAQLIAETGIPEDELRKVVDRLRADDCSFLVPSPSSVPELSPDTPIDVGHEALLRRWERLSGDPVIPAQGASATQQTGWLRAEDGDGRLYRGLLAFVDSEGGEGTTLPLDQVERRWKWWTSRPRTEAWAERYGGGFASVTRLFENSLGALEATRQAAERAAIALREQERSHAERLLREQIQRSRLRFAWSVVGLLVMFALLGFLTDRFVMPVRDRVNATMNYAQQDPTDDFRLRLLLLTAAIRISDEWPAWIVDNQSVKDKLRETLLRSPIFGGTFDAAGTDAEGRRIVTLAKNRLIVRDLLTGAESKPVTVPQTGAEAENEPMGPFVGLVTLSNGSQVAVVFRAKSGKLFVGEPGTGVLDTRFHLPEEFRAAGMVPPRADVLGGRLIFIGLHYSEGLLDQELVLTPQELVLNPRIRFMEGPQFEVSRTSSYLVDWDSTKRTARRLPILAEDCDAYAFLGRRENESNVSLAQLVLWSAKLHTAASPSPLPGNFEPTQVARTAVAFARKCGAIFVRNAVGDLQTIRLDAALVPAREVVTVPVPERLRDFVLPLYGQWPSLLAAAPRDKGWRAAWLIPSGLAVVDATLRGSGGANQGQLAIDEEDGRSILTGLGMGPAIGQLRLSGNGEFAILTYQPSLATALSLRVLDLRFEDRKKYLDGLSTDLLVHEACRVANLGDAYSHDNKLAPQEMEAWLGGQNAQQPCGGM